MTVSAEPPQVGSWRRLATGWLGPAISLLALVAVVAWALQQDAPSFPTDAGSLGLLALAVALYGVAWLARGWRWHWILRRAGVVHDSRDARALVAVGYMGNTVLPARGGELLRIVLLARHSSGGKRHALGSIIAERMLDAAALIGLFALLTWSGVAGSPTGHAPATIAAILALIALVAGAVYLRARARGRLTRFAEFVRPFSLAARPLVGRFGLGLLALTAAVWVAEGVICVLIGEALGLQIDLVEGLFIIVLAGFFAMIPAGPGFVGTFDAAVLFALEAVAVSGGDAVSFTLLLRFVLFVPITVLGLALLVTRYGGLRALRRRPEAA